MIFGLLHNILFSVIVFPVNFFKGKNILDFSTGVGTIGTLLSTLGFRFPPFFLFLIFFFMNVFSGAKVTICVPESCMELAQKNQKANSPAAQVTYVPRKKFVSIRVPFCVSSYNLLEILQTFQHFQRNMISLCSPASYGLPQSLSFCSFVVYSSDIF